LTLPKRWTILPRMIPAGLRERARSHPALRAVYTGYRAFKAQRAAQRLTRFLTDARFCPPEQAQAIARDWQSVSEHTQLSQAGILNLETMARYVIDNGVKGAFVECGTWRGGALSFWARAFLRNGGKPELNPLFGFDSFQGMPGVTAEDGSWASEMLHGKPIDALPREELKGSLKPHAMNAAEEETCRAIVAASGFPAARTQIVKGWFQDTLPEWKEKIGPIAVLRLDGDWYESTRTCLENLFDLVVPGGVVIIDDYGYFVGCQKAVNEFFLARQLKLELVTVDVCVRYLFKRAA
jgi:O-methyltransferase